MVTNAVLPVEHDDPGWQIRRRRPVGQYPGIRVIRAAAGCLCRRDHRHLHSHKVLVKIKKLHEKLHLFTAIREQLTREKTSDDMPGKRRIELFHYENISDKTQGTAQKPSHRE